jgi:fumarate reductase (CoM/CoB) subunit B
LDRREVELTIFRYDPESDAEPHYDTVKVAVDAEMPTTVLDLLRRVQGEHLPDLALHYSCRTGQCGSCTLKINGINRPACKTMVEGSTITIEPRDNCRIIRDLVVDTEGDLERLLEGRTAFKTRRKTPHRVSEEDYENVSDIRECIECFACMSTCPVVKASTAAKGPLTMRNIAQLAFDPRISDAKQRLTEALKAGCYSCTTCQKCTEVCDKDICVQKRVRQLRRSLYYDESLGKRIPKNIPLVMDTIKGTKNILNANNSERADGWAWLIEDEVDVPSLTNRQAKVGYFVGCVTSFKPSVDIVAQNTVQILHKIGEDFTIMGPDEFCCGFPSYLGGVDEDFVEHNLKAITDLGIETLVLTCPGCYRAFKVNYPERTGRPLPFKVQHFTEYMCEKLDSGLSFENKVSMMACYHDPCDLGRHSGVFDEPRRVLREAGVELVEFAATREYSDCCGMGGLLMVVDSDASNKIGIERVRQARETGASALVTACPACFDQFRRNADGLDIHEITDIILKAL